MRFTRTVTLSECLSDNWERFWSCRVRGRHKEKMDSHGHCYRCGKRLR